MKRIQNDRISRFGVRTSPEVKDEDWRSQHQRISDIHDRIDKCATQVRRNHDQNMLNLRRLTEKDQSRLLAEERDIMKRAYNVVARVAQYCTTATSRTSPDRKRLSSTLLADDSYKSTLAVRCSTYKNPSTLHSIYPVAFSLQDALTELTCFEEHMPLNQEVFPVRCFVDMFMTPHLMLAFR